jgi:hypothetical protein
VGSDKKLNRTVVDLSEKVTDVESQMTKLYRFYDTKLKEESQNIIRTLENRV